MRARWVGLSSWLVVLLAAGFAHATSYSVSPSGTDAGAGPWKTLQYAANHVAAGDVVTVENGTYAGFVVDEVAGTAQKRIVFRAATKGGAKITSASPTGGFAQDWVVLTSSSFITIDGFEVSGATRAGISILGNEDDGSDATDNIITNCHSHDNGGTSSAGRHDGIFSGFARNLTVADNVVHDNAEHGIYVSNAADNPIVERNDVYDNGVNGIQINADVSTGGDGIISNWRISQNRVHGNTGSAGINLDGACNGVLANNLVYGNSKGGVTLFQGDAATASSGNLIVNNTIYNANGSRAALQVADGADNNVVFNNILYAGSGVGLEVQDVTGLVHDYNLVKSYDGGSASTHESAPNASLLFTNLGANDFTSSGGSPAHDAGTATLGGKSAPSVDLVGGARPVGVIDIGCYESGATTNPNDAGTIADLATSPSTDASTIVDGGIVDQTAANSADGGSMTSTSKGCGGCTASDAPRGETLFALVLCAGVVSLLRRRDAKAAR